MEILIYLVVILMAISTHEMMHAFTGYWLGDDTAARLGRVTLNPLAHIDPFMTVLLPLVLFVAGAPVFGAAKPVPFNPSRLKYDEYGVLLVALAGPLTNLVLALGGVLVWQFFDLNTATWAGFACAAWVLVNFGFFVFNMIPIPPLDGSRVLYVFAPDSVRRWLDQLERYGLFVILALVIIVYSLNNNPIFQIINWFDRSFLT